MSVLSRFENALGAFIEGGARRLFRSKVQPIEVIRALERAMVGRRLVVPGAILVPNRLKARLNPVDFAELAALHGAVEREAATHLEQTARDQGWRWPAPFVVQLVEDPTVGRSRVLPEVTFDEAPAAESRQRVAETRRIEPLPPAAHYPSLVLVDEHGRQRPLDDRPITIGRALDNDMVIRDVRVSRHHVVLDPVGAVWLVRDLQSTNGTFIEGQRIDERLVDAGCELSLGGYRLFLRRG